METKPKWSSRKTNDNTFLKSIQTIKYQIYCKRITPFKASMHLLSYYCCFFGAMHPTVGLSESNLLYFEHSTRGFHHLRPRRSAIVTALFIYFFETFFGGVPHT